MREPAEARIALAEARIIKEQAEPRWRQAILDALDAGLPAVEVARIAGCTRQRVHQIKDSRSNRLDGRTR